MNATANNTPKPFDLKKEIANFLNGPEADRVRKILSEKDGEIFIGEFAGARFAFRAKGICRIEKRNPSLPLATCYDIEDAFTGPNSAAPENERRPEELIPFLLEQCGKIH